MKKSLGSIFAGLTLCLLNFSASPAEVLHLSFDEGTGGTAADSAISDGTPTPNDSVTLQNGAHFASGKVGSALELSSTASPWQHATFDSASLGDMITNAPGGTFACWLMVPDTLWSASTNKDKGDLLFLALPTSSSTTRFNVQIRRQAAIRFLARCNDTDAQTSLQTTNYMYVSNQWVHIACVANYPERYMTIYTNGQVAATMANISNWGASPTVCSSLQFTNAGVGMNWPNTDEAFIGRLDELRFWNEPLGDAQVAALYAEYAGASGPHITQVQLTGAAIVLRGTSGHTNGSYAVLASTSVALAQNQWPSIATNLFDGNGNFDCTNPVSPGDLRKFYRLLVLGAGTP